MCEAYLESQSHSSACVRLRPKIVGQATETVAGPAFRRCVNLVKQANTKESPSAKVKAFVDFVEQQLGSLTTADRWAPLMRAPK